MVSSEILTLGSSLPVPVQVPNVQELAREPIITVPQRYLRPDEEFPATLSNESLPAIPTIDMKKLLVEDSLPSELEKLHSACKDWGFFQLVYHSVSSSLIEKMKSETQQLFNLPLQEKKKYWKQPGSVEGFGQSYVVVSEEHKLDWGDLFSMVTLPTSPRNHSLLEKLPLVYRETVATYALEVQKLALDMLGFMAKALGMDVEEINEFFADGYQEMRSNYYPPCPQPQQVIGLAPHSDANAITILLQINEVQGLEIKKDGTWIPVKPIPNAFIINVGDMLEIITNGAHKSVLHRGTVNSTQERLSVAAFCCPRLTAEIGPSRSLIGPQNPPLYRRVIMEKYLKDYLRLDQMQTSVDLNKVSFSIQVSEEQPDRYRLPVERFGSLDLYMDRSPSSISWCESPPHQACEEQTDRYGLQVKRFDSLDLCKGRSPSSIKWGESPPHQANEEKTDEYGLQVERFGSLDQYMGRSPSSISRCKRPPHQVHQASKHPHVLKPKLVA